MIEAAAMVVFTPAHDDILADGSVDLLDLQALLSHCLDDDCFNNEWCGGADLNADSVIDRLDFQVLSSH